MTAAPHSLILAVVLLAATETAAQDKATRPVTTERFEDYKTSQREQDALRDEAITQAREVTDSRLESMNELRAQITSERALYVPRAAFETLIERTSKIEQEQAAARSEMMTWVAAIGIIFALLQVGLKMLPAKAVKE